MQRSLLIEFVEYLSLLCWKTLQVSTLQEDSGLDQTLNYQSDHLSTTDLWVLSECIPENRITHISNYKDFVHFIILSCDGWSGIYLLSFDQYLIAVSFKAPSYTIHPIFTCRTLLSYPFLSKLWNMELFWWLGVEHKWNTTVQLVHAQSYFYCIIRSFVKYWF